jgi:hypothetical protein
MKQVFFIAAIFLSIGITNAQTTFSEQAMFYLKQNQK